MEKMMDKLRFDPQTGISKICQLDGEEITYRAFENIPYCSNPADSIQLLNLFVPEAYFEGKAVNGYTGKTAPIFCPNTVGGYMPGPAGQPGYDHKGQINSIFKALEHGYVVMAAGVRGRTSGKSSAEFFEGSVLCENGKKESKMQGPEGCGKAPAFVVDMKAAIRWLRHNKDLIFGDTDYIITNGTSAGGALSALAGASGNHPDFESYLKEIGAADERDDVFAASCYCPIHNLEHADAAYEWLFHTETEYHRTKKVRTDTGLVRLADDGLMNPAQIEISKILKDAFPAYVNSLELADKELGKLTLNPDGNGSFRDYVAAKIVESAQKERDENHMANNLAWLAVPGSEVEKQTWLPKVISGAEEQTKLQNSDDEAKKQGNLNKETLDWDQFVKAITRMKPAPAFDALDGNSPENEEFGDQTVPYKHFNPIVYNFMNQDLPMANSKIVDLMNPVHFISKQDHCGLAPHWRIRHGVYDRDTSLAIPAILALSLEKQGITPDFAFPWGLPHAGDYDLPELFEWIDECVREDKKEKQAVSHQTENDQTVNDRTVNDQAAVCGKGE